MRAAILVLAAALAAAPVPAEAQLLGKLVDVAGSVAKRSARRAATRTAVGAAAAAVATDSSVDTATAKAATPAKVATPAVATTAKVATPAVATTAGSGITTRAAYKASARTPAAMRPDSMRRVAGPDAAGVPLTGVSTAATHGGAAGELTFNREAYSYPGRGRRDPFLSLLKSGDLRPLLSDLKLVTVLYDPTGRNSVAILRDLSTKDQYRVKLGQQLGRMRVAQIQPKQLVFTIEEFGYSRQETLSLSDTTSARTR